MLRENMFDQPSAIPVELHSGTRTPIQLLSWYF
jgi:hypothetical protein